MKTENAAEVGMHAFERAGLGKAPFRFVGASDNVITYPDGTSKAGGSCDYCGTGIRTECHIKSADGKLSKVGCNCIEKVGETGILKAYKTSPEFRAKQRAIRGVKAASVLATLKDLIETKREVMAAMPHPRGFTDRKTGKPLSYLDQVEWLFRNSGAAGRASLLKMIQKDLVPAEKILVDAVI